MTKREKTIKARKKNNKPKVEIKPYDVTKLKIDKKLIQDEEYYKGLSLVEMLDVQIKIETSQCLSCKAKDYYAEYGGNGLTQRFKFCLEQCPLGNQLLMIGEELDRRTSERRKQRKLNKEQNKA